MRHSSLAQCSSLLVLVFFLFLFDTIKEFIFIIRSFFLTCCFKAAFRLCIKKNWEPSKKEDRPFSRVWYNPVDFYWFKIRYKYRRQYSIGLDKYCISQMKWRDKSRQDGTVRSTVIKVLREIFCTALDSNP